MSLAPFRWCLFAGRETPSSRQKNSEEKITKKTALISWFRLIIVKVKGDHIHNINSDVLQYWTCARQAGSQAHCKVAFVTIYASTRINISNGIRILLKANARSNLASTVDVQMYSHSTKTAPWLLACSYGSLQQTGQRSLWKIYRTQFSTSKVRLSLMIDISSIFK